MRQQVNLHQPILSHSHKVFGAAAATRAGIVIVAALLIIGGYDARKVQRLEVAAQALRERQVQQEQAVASAGTLSAARAAPKDIEARTQATDVEVRWRLRALATLHTGALGRTTGFAARMEALASRRPDGIWIDRIALAGGTNAMSLSGATLDADLVPRYLLSLAQQAALGGARFDRLLIERADAKSNGTGQIHFHATSVAAPIAQRKEEPT
jgi:Tfp pilus assembly protein PilN